MLKITACELNKPIFITFHSGSSSHIYCNKLCCNNLQKNINSLLPKTNTEYKNHNKNVHFYI